MISYLRGPVTRIVARPNRSASWQSNKRVIIGIGILSGAIAGGFLLIGAWVILPFAGLEIAALSGALYYVNWKLEYRHVVTLDDELIVIEKGFYHPKQTWQWPRADSYLVISQQERSHAAPEVSLCRTGEAIRIGEFLSDIDTAELIRCLRDAGVRVRADAAGTDLDL